MKVLITLLLLLLLAGCGDDTSEKKSDCGDRCQSWEHCVESTCKLNEGFCELNSDCENNTDGKTVCDLKQESNTFHQCIEAAGFDCSSCVAPQKCNDAKDSCIFDCATCIDGKVCNEAQDGCVDEAFDCSSCVTPQKCNDAKDGCIFDCATCTDGKVCNDAQDGCVDEAFDCSSCVAPQKCNDAKDGCIFDCATCTGEYICNAAKDGCTTPQFDCSSCTGHLECNEANDGCVAKDGMCDTSADCAANERKKDCDQESHTCTDLIPCDPNFCLNDPDLVAAHKTRCMPEVEGEYKCVCNLFEDYYDSDGICCKFNSSNVNGTCVCNDGYVLVDGECVVACRYPENPVGSLNGYCEPGYTCRQGNCVEDLCLDVDCSGKPNSTCQAGICECNTPTYHKESYGSGEDEYYCCGDNQVANSVGCLCATGYEDNGNGNCVPEPENPCKEGFDNPCKDTGITYQNTCVQDDSEAGYHCECNSGYELINGACEVKTYANCPSNFQCLGGYCVTNDWQCDPDSSCAPPEIESCITNADCCYGDTCNSICDKATGLCQYCGNDDLNCPSEQVCKFSTCLPECDTQEDCDDNRTCKSGYCIVPYCTTTDDCEAGEQCVNSSGETGQGRCHRMPCTDSLCSPASPSGSCETGVCLYGTCVTSCDPDPCTDENDPFRHNCEMQNGVPFCVCDAGYEVRDGKCQPVVQTSCPSGFTCSNGYCTDLNNSSIVCSEDSHCGVVGMSCSPASPAGSCNGCDATHPCPGTLDCYYGYCLQECLGNGDCHDGMVCKTNSLGTFCGKKDCTSASDCPTGYTCGASLTCERQPCE